MSFFSRLFGTPRPSAGDPDDLTLRALADAGANLARETETLFFLYFPTEAHAQSAANVAQREGFVARVSAPVQGSEWLCRLTREMVLSRAAIKATRERLEELATSLSGEFDGWEAAVRS